MRYSTAERKKFKRQLKDMLAESDSTDRIILAGFMLALIADIEDILQVVREYRDRATIPAKEMSEDMKKLLAFIAKEEESSDDSGE